MAKPFIWKPEIVQDNHKTAGGGGLRPHLPFAKADVSSFPLKFEQICYQTFHWKIRETLIPQFLTNYVQTTSIVLFI